MLSIVVLPDTGWLNVGRWWARMVRRASRIIR